MAQVARASAIVLGGAGLLAGCAPPPAAAPVRAPTEAVAPALDEALRATLAERAAGATAVAVVRPERLAEVVERLALPLEVPRGLDPAAPVIVALGVLPSRGRAEGLRVGAWTGGAASGLRHEAWLPAIEARRLTRDLEAQLDALDFAPTGRGRWAHASGWTVWLRGGEGELRLTAFEPDAVVFEADEETDRDEPGPMTPALRAALDPGAAVAIYTRADALERLGRWQAFRAATVAAGTLTGDARAAFLGQAAGRLAATPRPRAEIADVALRLGGAAPALDVVATLTPFGAELLAAAHAEAGRPLAVVGRARATLRAGLSAGPLLTRTTPAPFDLPGVLRHPGAALRGLLGAQAVPSATTWALRPPSASAPGLGSRSTFAFQPRRPSNDPAPPFDGFAEGGPLPEGALALFEAVPSRLGLAGVPDVRGVLRQEGGALVWRVGAGTLAPLGLVGAPVAVPEPGPEGAACLDRLRLRIDAARALDLPRRAETLRRLVDESAVELDCVAADPALAGAGLRAELALMAAEHLALAWRPDAARDALRTACAHDGGRACRGGPEATAADVPTVPAVCPTAPPPVEHRVRLGPVGPLLEAPPAGGVVGLAADPGVPYARLRDAVADLHRAGATAVFALVRDAADRPHVVGPLHPAEAPGASVARVDDDRLSLRLGGRAPLARAPLCGGPGCVDAAALPLGAIRGLVVQANADAPWGGVAQVAGAACRGVALAPPR